MDAGVTDRGSDLVRIDGHLLDLRIVGEGDGSPSVVFLHEGLGSVDLWRSFPADVVDRVGERAVVYSRYGHGWSDVQREPRPLDFMHHEGLVVLPELLEAVGVVDPILIGHSDGASIALLHASEHPVAGLVLLAPHVFTEPMGLAEIAGFTARFHDTDLAQRMAKYHRDPVATLNAWANVWNDPQFVPWNIESCLSSIACPVLVIQGVDDQYGTLAQVEAVASQVSGEVDQLILDSCRHSPHLDRPDETVQATVDFINLLRGRLDE
ncbi:MAG: alpha/beta hydrolase [Acidimicrobiia bacterium]